MSSPRFLLPTILHLLLVAACGASEALVQATPTVDLLANELPTTQTRSLPSVPTLAPTQSPSVTEGLALTLVPVPGSSEFVLVQEQSIGGYTIRMWQPAPGTGMYNYATISTAGQPEIRIESVSAIASLPAEDVTGDGFPDISFETQVGGHRCCRGTIVYNLGPTPEEVLEITSLPDYYGTGSGAFQDLDGDGRYEFITRDPLSDIPCTGPTVKAILQYVPGQGFVGAGSRFAEAYVDDIAAHARRAEEEVELSRDGCKCGVYELIVDYLYSGQSDRAWRELQRLYLGQDIAQFQSQLELSVSQGRFFVPAASPGPFSSRLSLACSAPQENIINPEPFWHAVESFRLTR